MAYEPQSSAPPHPPPNPHLPTIQVTAFKVDPARLAGLNARLRGMRLGNFEFASEQLRLGDLRGNR